MPRSRGLEFIGARDRIVAADMDADGVDDIGVWIPDRSGAATDQLGEWYMLVSNDLRAENRVAGSVALLDHPFSERPFGHDFVARFGAEFGIPVLGNFDPPVAGVSLLPLVTINNLPLPEMGLPGLYDPGSAAFFLRNLHSGGDADTAFSYGVGGLGWIALSGDWDGDGVATVGQYDPANGTFFLKNSTSGGDADVAFSFGVGGLGWLPLVGDWNADGKDTVGLYDPATGQFFLREYPLRRRGRSDVRLWGRRPGLAALGGRLGRQWQRHGGRLPTPGQPVLPRTRPAGAMPTSSSPMGWED